MFRHLMKLYTEARYETIQLAVQRLPLTNRVQILAQLFCVCPNTIRSAIAWQPGSPCGNPDALGLLQDHHIPYVETHTLANRSMTNYELAQELVAFFPDLGRCNEPTVGRCRDALGLHFCPMRSGCLIDINSLFRIVRIQNR
jgi:hypothetical protein